MESIYAIASDNYSAQPGVHVYTYCAVFYTPTFNKQALDRGEISLCAGCLYCFSVCC